VPRKIWLHNGGHGTPGNSASYTLPDGTVWTYQTTVHRWFDHWLWNVENGIMDEPRAILQRENGANLTYADWPDAATQQVDVRLTAAAADQFGGLTTAGVVAPRQAAQSFVDDGRNLTATTLISNPDVVSPNRLIYLSDVLSAPARLSRIMVTRGWMDVQNRVRRDKTDPIQQGHLYDFEWPLHPDDYVFQAGRRIGLVVFSTDWDFTLRPSPGTQLTVEPGFSRLILPLVGGASF
jgi:X-Pro dipeptidyl-peptidase